MNAISNSRVLVAATLAFLLVVATGGTASAQIASGAPVVRELTDANGVDLMSGKMVSTYNGPSIGPAGANFSITRQVRGGGVWDSYVGAIVPDGVGVRVIAQGVADRFTGSGPYTSAEGTGATLTVSGSTWTYTSRSGIVVTYFTRTTDYANPGDAVALLSSIVYPNNERLTFGYTNESICEWSVGSECWLLKSAVRLTSITTNRGYRVEMGYPAPGYVSGPGPTAVDFFFVACSIVVWNDTVAGSATDSLGMTYVWQPNFIYTMELTDNAGRVTKYKVKDGIGPTEIYRPGSATPNVSITYAGDGRVLSVNADGVVTNYTYSNVGLIYTTNATTAAGTRTVTWDIAKNRVISDRNELNQTATYEYNAQDRLYRVIAPEGNYAQYTYDARGNVIETLFHAKSGSGLSDVSLTADFDDTCTNPKTCNQPLWTRDAKGNQTDYTYDPTHGGVVTVTQPPPATGYVRPQTRYAYTALEAWYLNSSGVLAASGQPIYLLASTSSCRTSNTCNGNSDELKTTIGYGPTGVANNLWPVTTTSRDGTSLLVSTTTLGYDLDGNVLTTDGPLAGTDDTKHTRYDHLRRIEGEIGPDPDGIGPRPRAALRYTYSTAGNLITVVSGNVAGTTEYDWWSGFTTLQTINMSYDAAGRIIRRDLTVAGTTHTVEQMSYDTAGRLQCTVQRMNSATFSSPPSACTLGTSGSFGPDRITLNTYDAASRVTKVTTGYGSGAAIDVHTVTFTTNGKVATLTDGRGNRTTYEYDGFDRLLKTRFPSPTTAGTSSTTDYEQLSYDVNSNVATIRARNASTITLTVDNLDRIVLRDLPSGSDTYLAYDNHGRLLYSRFDNPTGPGVDHTYDGLGRLYTRTTFGRTLTYAYDAASRRTRLTHPDGFHADYAYDTTDQLTSIIDSTSTTLATFTFDAQGRRTGIVRANGANTTSAYDTVGRLSSLTQNLASTNFDGTATFTRAPSSQVVTRTQSNDPAYTWTTAAPAMTATYSGLNQLTQNGATAVGHDSLGNLTTGESTYTYGHDIENRLRSATAGGTTVSINYDPLGTLSEVIVNGTSTKYLYDGPDLVAEYTSGGAVARRYVHSDRLDEPLVWYEGAGTSDRRYFHTDELGSIVAISNNAGTGTVSFKYSPYGESTNPASSRFGFTGQAWLDQPGLYYYKSRFYSPKLGRFLQPDGSGYAGGMNLYGYVGGDPANLVDPFGFDDCPPSTAGEVVTCARRAQDLSWLPWFFDTFMQDLHFLDLLEKERDAESERARQKGQAPRCRWETDASSWEITISFYKPTGGGEGQFGSDEGNKYVTGRYGWGWGGGGTWSSMGNIPGPPLQNRDQGGLVIAATIQVDFSAGPVVGSWDVLGVAWNVTEGTWTPVAGPSMSFKPGWGIKVAGSAGIQATLYSKRSQKLVDGQGTCRL